MDFESGQEDNGAQNFHISKLPDGRPARDNRHAVEAHVDNIYNQHDLNQDGQIDVQVAQGLLQNFTSEVMGLENEQKLQSIIEEAKLSHPGSLNKQEMAQIIYEFQESLRINPEQ